MTAAGRRTDKLMHEISLYLAFMDEAHERDSLWEEYVAWKALTAKRSLKERLSPYTLH